MKKRLVVLIVRLRVFIAGVGVAASALISAQQKVRHSVGTQDV